MDRPKTPRRTDVRQTTDEKVSVPLFVYKFMWDQPCFLLQEPQHKQGARAFILFRVILLVEACQNIWDREVNKNEPKSVTGNVQITLTAQFY